MLRDASQTALMRREDGFFQPVPKVDPQSDLVQRDINGNPLGVQDPLLYAEGFPAQDFESGPETPSVSSGILEGSNVSTVESLVKFIDHMRNFEMQTKVIKEMKDNDQSGASMMRLS
jgi:flagellar basal-body rod protein FlgF